MAIDLSNIDRESVYMTAGRDYNRHSAYEFLIGAYELQPTNRALDGEPLPVTLHRETGFRSNATAKRAGRKWAEENLQ